MVTKEWNSEEKCCLYASDYHLEMILLPYIESKIDESNFVIITQKDLSKTIKVLLDRVYLNNDKKNKIIKLNWDNNYIEKMKYIDKLKENNKLNIIVNGDYNYIKKIHNTLNTIKNNNIEIVDCYCIYDKSVRIDEIKKKYKVFINTIKI